MTTIFTDTDEVRLEISVASFDVINTLSDNERVAWIKLICNSIQRPGTIGRIRDVVNGEGYND